MRENNRRREMKEGHLAEKLLLPHVQEPSKFVLGRELLRAKEGIYLQKKKKRKGSRSLGW